MGWFSKDTTPTQQFGTPQQTQMNGYNGMQGMGAMGMMQQQQNPMMQQMANDPIIALARMLELHDPMAVFLASHNLPTLIELMGEVVRLSLKEFLSQATFTLDKDTGALTLDTAKLPSQLSTLSPENLALTMNRVQQSAQMTIQQNAQQKQMLLNAHQMTGGMNGTQPGFFGSLLGSALGNQMQNGNAAKLGAGLVL